MSEEGKRSVGVRRWRSERREEVDEEGGRRGRTGGDWEAGRREGLMEGGRGWEEKGGRR